MIYSDHQVTPELSGSAVCDSTAGAAHPHMVQERGVYFSRLEDTDSFCDVAGEPRKWWSLVLIVLALVVLALFRASGDNSMRARRLCVRRCEPPEELDYVPATALSYDHPPIGPGPQSTFTLGTPGSRDNPLDATVPFSTFSASASVTSVVAALLSGSASVVTVQGPTVGAAIGVQGGILGEGIQDTIDFFEIDDGASVEAQSLAYEEHKGCAGAAIHGGALLACVQCAGAVKGVLVQSTIEAGISVFEVCKNHTYPVTRLLLHAGAATYLTYGAFKTLSAVDGITPVRATVISGCTAIPNTALTAAIWGIARGILSH